MIVLATAWLPWAALMALAVILCAIFSGLEIGIYVLNKIRLDLHAEAGMRQARRLRRMLRSPDNLLAVLLIGTNLASYAATFAISSMFYLAGAGHRTEWYTLMIVTPVLFIFGESVPKNIFQRLAETLVYRLVWLLRGASVLFNACGLVPLVRGFSWVLSRLAGAQVGAASPLGHEGVAAVFAEGHASGMLTHAQSVMADRIMRLGNVTLVDVMNPMRKVVSASRDVTRDELMELLRRNDYSRYPLVDAAGQVAGILNIYDFLASGQSARPVDLADAPLVLPQTTHVTDALYRLQRTAAEMIVVSGPEGKHLGIATVKDLVEEIVGELEEW